MSGRIQPDTYSHTPPDSFIDPAPKQIIQQIIEEQDSLATTRRDLQSAFKYFASHLPVIVDTNFRANCFQLMNKPESFLFGSSAGKIAIIEKKEIQKEIDIKVSIKSIILYDNDTFCFAGLANHKIIKIYLGTFELIESYEGHEGAITKLIMAKDEKFIYSSSQDGTIRR